MKKTNDGGPAFPVPSEEFPNGGIQYGQWGMSLRDYFAGQALSGIILHPHGPHGFHGVAADAYKVADAMLEAREQQTEEET